MLRHTDELQLERNSYLTRDNHISHRSTYDQDQEP